MSHIHEGHQTAFDFFPKVSGRFVCCLEQVVVAGHGKRFDELDPLAGLKLW